MSVKYSLRTKLSLSYVLITLICVLLLSVLTNVFLEKQFREYVIEKQELRNEDLVTLISQQYKLIGKWDDKSIENIGITALEEGLIIKVLDASGFTVWDATVHNNGMCTQMLSHMAQNMKSHYPNWKGEYVENQYTIKNDFKEVGTLEIGYFGPYYFNDNDLAFISTLNKIIVGVGGLSLILALVLGTYMSKRLSHPIARVIHAAHLISKGYFDGRVKVKTNTKEINQLILTVNQLAETLEKQELLRKRLTADVAHELRTPLATLQSHMEAMIDGIWKPESQRLRSCHEEIMRIGRMVGDMEKLARYESENLILNKSDFDPAELLKSILQNFESDYKAKGVEIILHARCHKLFADRDKVSQIVVNLLSNALKYTKAGGCVDISIDGVENEVVLRVKDTGEGIPAEDLPYIFERFYRSDPSRNRLTGGTGIGLTITKALVEAHHGKITVRSEWQKGTEVMVTFPRGTFS